MLYDVNLGTRDYFTYKDAMLSNSLFSNFLKKHHLNVYKEESTRDLVCLDFDFGSRSYEEDKQRLETLLAAAEGNAAQRLEQALRKASIQKDCYRPKTRDQIRETFYENGVPITYQNHKKDGTAKAVETITYKMLYRTSAKAKLGQAIFINERLYDIAYDWLTMGLGDKLPEDNAKIVELSAYAPLTTSTITDTIHIPVEDILILEDKDSSFVTLANVVKAQEYKKSDKNKLVTSKRCEVVQEYTTITNTLWDGMGLIESSILPDWINGMALLRNHFFKMCGFRSHLQLFFKEWCRKNNLDYDTYQVTDMFGSSHYLKDIKVVTTDNAIKWKKFAELMGGTPASAHQYWCGRVNADGCLWGIVKTDHPSKLGSVQQMSYQMLNTLPCTKEDVKDIAQTSIHYVKRLKTDDSAFYQFLTEHANEVNHYEMLSALYKHNPQFAESTWFRNEKKKIISSYVYRLRTGKITIHADNLTVCGNPYALLLYSVGENWSKDPTLRQEDGAVQCYTTRFENGEYLAAFRNPHNAPNGICCLHNVYSKEMKQFFSFSDNILAVNCIRTDIQSRANGMDFDLTHWVSSVEIQI